MDHSQFVDEESLVRFIRLLSETIKRRFAKSYTVQTIAKRDTYAYYLVKNHENSYYNLTIEEAGSLWTFTMNQGLNRLYVRFNEKNIMDKPGFLSLMDVVRRTETYQYNGTPGYAYHSSKNKLSFEEYIYGGAREVDVNDTLRPISEAWVEEQQGMRRNQNHILTTLITAQIALQFIKYGPLKESSD